MLNGTMVEDVKLLGTGLTLQTGQRVRLTPATNLPQGGYFAAPLGGVWADGIDRHADDSIHLDGPEVTTD